MQDTRQQILEILKRRGEITVQDLSRALKLTSVTVRHHLEILRSEGYITEPEVRRSSRPGRPRYVYRLTSTAADLFPNNYSGLANALFTALTEHTNAEEREQLLKEAAQNLALGVGELPTAPLPRLQAIVSYLKQLGFVTRLETQPDGEHYLHICNCPYHYVAQQHPEICKLDFYMLQALLDPATLERLPGHAFEDDLCRYKITFPEG